MILRKIEFWVCYLATLLFSLHNQNITKLEKARNQKVQKNAKRQKSHIQNRKL